MGGRKTNCGMTLKNNNNSNKQAKRKDKKNINEIQYEVQSKYSPWKKGGVYKAADQSKVEMLKESRRAEDTGHRED